MNNSAMNDHAIRQIIIIRFQEACIVSAQGHDAWQSLFDWGAHNLPQCLVTPITPSVREMPVRRS